MPTKITNILFIIILAGSIWSCNKEGSAQTEIRFQVRHHERFLPDVDIQVYLNQTEVPGLDELDQHDAIFTTDENGRAKLSAIPLGNHWFVALGYDEVIREQVIGHMPLRFDLSQLVQDTIMYVGEEEYYKIGR